MWEMWDAITPRQIRSQIASPTNSYLLLRQKLKPPSLNPGVF